MTPGRLFAILAAVALLFAPAMTARAMAGQAPTGHMPMMERSGHCHMPLGGPADHHKSDGKSCCISMCMALAVQPQTAATIETLAQSPAQFSVPVAPVGYLGEIATPPPRNA